MEPPHDRSDPDPERSETGLGLAQRAVLGGTIVAGLTVRLVALGRVPGISGDEAWFGANVQEFLHGGPTVFRTPTGNLLNPFHSLPLLAVSLFMRPSFVLLRIPAAWWGGLVLLLAFPLLRRPLGSRVALFATVLLCFSPPLVAFSRLGCDPSASPFFGLLALAMAMDRRLVLSCVALVCAVVVHPTNVFLAPIVVSTWIPHLLEGLARMDPIRRRRRLLVLLFACATGFLVGLLGLRALATRVTLPTIHEVVGRARSLPGWLHLASGVLRLFSGVTTGRTTAESIPQPFVIVMDVALSLVLVLPLVLGWRRGARHVGMIVTWLLAGVAASLLLVHLTTDVDVFEPGSERYSVFLVVPLCVLAALSLRSVRVGRHDFTFISHSLLVTLIVAGLGAWYLVPLVRYGGSSSNRICRTGPVEPKEAAYRFVLADSRGGCVALLAANWWLYWPIQYLSADQRSRIHVLPAWQESPGVLPVHIHTPLFDRRPDRVYAVAFYGTVSFNQLQSSGAPAFTARDSIGRPVLSVFRLGAAGGRALLSTGTENVR